MEESEFKDSLPQENLLTKERVNFQKFIKIMLVLFLILILILGAGIIISLVLKKDGTNIEKGEKGDKGDK